MSHTGYCRQSQLLSRNVCGGGILWSKITNTLRMLLVIISLKTDDNP